MLAAIAFAAVALPLLSVASSPRPAEAALAGGTADCNGNTVYGINQVTRVVSEYNATTGSRSTTTRTFGNTPGFLIVNGLALPSGGGRYMYAFGSFALSAGTAGQVLRLDLQTNTTTYYPAPVGAATDSSNVYVGAINPANGLYYFGRASTTGVLKLWAFNTTTNAWVSGGQPVALIPNWQSNGDIAFDGTGALYVVTNIAGNPGQLVRVNDPIPTTGSASPPTLSSTVIATLPLVSTPYAGLAFTADGSLIVGTASPNNLLRVNPQTGAVIGPVLTAADSVADLASCQTPNTIRLRKNLPAGRFAAGDQFGLAITGGGLTTGNTATTTGSGGGIQSQVAGPVLGLDGTTFTITETAAGTTSLANYATTWSCIDTANGNAAVASGTGTSGTFTMPSTTVGSAVQCTFTNTPGPVDPPDPLECTGDTVYGVNAGNPPVVREYDAVTGASSIVGTFPQTSSMNAIGIPPGGGPYLYGWGQMTGPTGAGNVVRVDVVTGQVTGYTPPPGKPVGPLVLAGAVNPVNGVYYFAHVVPPDVTFPPPPWIPAWDVYAFDPSTGVMQPSRVARIIGPTGNADFAFDAAGTLYLVTNPSVAAGAPGDPGQLVRVNGALPTTAGSTELSTTLITGLPGGVGSYAAAAFVADGSLVIGTTGTNAQLLRVDPQTGAILSTATPADSIVDLASCQSANSIRLRKNLPDGRFAAGNQFGLAITGGGISAGNTATTAGTATGIQPQVAGPVLGLDGTTYTITETAAGTTSLANYHTTWACIDTANGNAAVASGTGTTGTFTMPSTTLGSAVQCTFTNALSPPSPPSAITLRKALDGTRASASDQFTMQIRQGSISGSIVGTTGAATTTGSGSTITTGTGTTTLNPTTPAATYYLTEGGAGSTDLTPYAKAISCVDTAGVTTGPFPSGGVTGTTGSPGSAAFNPAVGHAVTPVAGAMITCTVTNSYTPTPSPTLTLIKEVENDHGGAADPEDFELTATPTSPSGPVIEFTSGDTEEVDPGELEIGEAQLPGYELTGIVCERDDDGAEPLDLDDPVVEIDDGEAWVCTLTNTDLPGSVSWEKVDADDTDEALGGSEWVIVGPSPATASLPVTDCVALPCTGPDTDPAKGRFTVEGLDWGSYTLAETKAPPGFALDTTAWPFTIAAADLGHVFGDPFENEKQDVPLIPLTGGMGEHQFLIAGAGLLASLLVLVEVRRRRTSLSTTGGRDTP